MSKNQLASYFKDTNDESMMTGGSGGSGALSDLTGRSFFDLISECKDFNERDSTSEDQTNSSDTYFEIWPQTSTASSNRTAIESFQFALVEPLQDPIKHLVLKYFGQQEANKRVLPNAETVIADANGLQILIKCGSFRSVVNLTYKILTNLSRKDQPNDTSKQSSKSIYSPYSFQIWFIRIAVLMKLKLFKEAEQELKQFENFEKSEFFYESHPEFYPNRKGSMIPFGFRVLAAELPQYLLKSEESLSSLSRLLETVNRILENDLDQYDENARTLWNERKQKVQLSLVNILISRKNYDKAIETLFEIVESKYCKDKCSIWSCIGKIFIQIGDVIDASNSFIKAKQFSKAESKSDQCRNFLNLSLLKIFTGQYQEAYEFLKEAHNLAPDNPTVINNMAFCLFYSGNLKEAIAFIEKQMHNNPRKTLNESLLFNLCTLYELESSKSQQKKANLLLWLNVYTGDGFNEGSIQLQ